VDTLRALEDSTPISFGHAKPIRRRADRQCRADRRHRARIFAHVHPARHSLPFVGGGDTRPPMQQAIAATAATRPPLATQLRLAGGVMLCLAIATLAYGAARFAPLVGAPLFAIGIGVVLTNTAGEKLWLSTWRLGDVSRLCLKGGIILLGASLNIGDIARTGLDSLPLLFVTIVVGLGCALGLGRLMGVEWRMRCLIGMGTTICGGSAIAALAPVIRAKAEEIAYAITVIFFFNMVAVFTFPVIGHLLRLSDGGFGLWDGTAVNDTSAVVAAGFAYSKAAGITATIVKLTRTTLIIPLVLGFGLAMPWLDRSSVRSEASLARRVYHAVPGFILLFVAAAALNSLGLLGHYAPDVQLLGRWVMVIALAAVGLQAHWRAFAGAGTKPLLLGFATWIAVAVASLAIQTWSHTL
jgi:uncharacterized integral membrane protein (TIGR00698 family)